MSAITSTPVPASTASASNSSSTSNALNNTEIASNFTEFLQLLTTQLKNQDPLSPLDTNQFTQQLVSFSQVEQAIDTNKNLQTLIALQNASQTVSALPLVGRTIEYADGTAPLANGQASFSYTLPSNAAAATLAVVDANGKTVFTRTAETAAGRHGFTWDGTTSAGANWTLNATKPSTATITIADSTGQTAYTGTVAVNSGAQNFTWDGHGNDGKLWPAGKYTLTATAVDASGQSTAISTQVQAPVDSVDLTQTPPVLSINGQNYTMDQLQKIVAH